MMVAASQHFETVEGFVNAVKEARGTQRKNIFSFFARSDATKELYQAPDLKTFKFN